MNVLIIYQKLKIFCVHVKQGGKLNLETKEDNLPTLVIGARND